MRAGIHLNSADPLNGNFDWPQPISKRNGQAGIKSSNREINPFRYPAGCKAAKQFEERLRRYSYHLKRFAFGPDRLAHLSSWLKERLVRTAHRTAAIVGTPLSILSKSIVDRQRIAADEYHAMPYGGRVYLFKAESGSQLFGDPELGWKGILSDLVIYFVPGDHGTINTGSNLKILAQKLAWWLEGCSVASGEE